MNNLIKLAFLCLFVGLIACSDDILPEDESFEYEMTDPYESSGVEVSSRTVPCTLDLEAVSNCCISFEVETGPYDYFIDYGDGTMGDDSDHCYDNPGTYNIVLYTMDGQDEMCSVAVAQTILECEDELCDSYICWDEILHQEYDCVGGITVELPNGTVEVLTFSPVDLDLGYGDVSAAIEKAIVELEFEITISNTGSQDNCLGIFINSEVKIISLNGDNCQGGPIGPGSIFESECNPQEIDLETTGCGILSVTYDDCCVTIQLHNETGKYLLKMGDGEEIESDGLLVNYCYRENGIFPLEFLSDYDNGYFSCAAYTEVTIDQCNVYEDCSSYLCWVDMLGTYDCVGGITVKHPDGLLEELYFNFPIDVTGGYNAIVSEMILAIQSAGYEVVIEPTDPNVDCQKGNPSSPTVGFFVESPLMMVNFIGSNCVNLNNIGNSTEFTSDCGYQ